MSAPRRPIHRIPASRWPLLVLWLAVTALVAGVVAAAASPESSAARARPASDTAPGTRGGPGTAVPPSDSRSTIANVAGGEVEGRSTTSNVDEFLGIPYAAPPVGSLRWQPPQPVTAWTGIRSALTYGSRCPQTSGANVPSSVTEDCLDVNVYTPARVESGLPVLIMIHGGGLTSGAGDQHDGSLLASTDNMVVVSLNYRLGVFGFLSLPGLTSPPYVNGNFGLLDQEAALRWVRDNIAAFGGDPARVTIDGQSAGGRSVCALLASPAAKGLFAQAIIESGNCTSQSESTTEAASLAFAARAGCTTAATAAACLRAKPTSALLAARGGYHTDFTWGGADLPVAPGQAVASGDYNTVPVLMGTNHDEARAFTQGYSSYTADQYEQFITENYGTVAAQVLAQYPFASYASPYTASYAIGAVWTDSGHMNGIGGCAEQNLATELAGSGKPVYFYQFDDRTAPSLNDKLPGYQFGAAHSMELPYLWPSFNNGYSLYALLTQPQRELSAEMIRYWGAFVRTGAPSVAGQPNWPGYRTGQLMSLHEGHRSTVTARREFDAEHQCSFWNGPGKAYEGS